MFPKVCFSLISLILIFLVKILVVVCRKHHRVMFYPGRRTNDGGVWLSGRTARCTRITSMNAQPVTKYPQPSCHGSKHQTEEGRLLRRQGFCSVSCSDQASVCDFRAHTMHVHFLGSASGALVGFWERSVSLLNCAVPAWTFPRLREAAHSQLHCRECPHRTDGESKYYRVSVAGCGGAHL